MIKVPCSFSERMLKVFAFLTVLWFIAVVWAFIMVVPAKAVQMYWRTSVLGGTSSAMDGISAAQLATGDSCIVSTAANTFNYYYSSTSTAAASYPSVVKPVSAGSTGRWLLSPSYAAPFTELDPSVNTLGKASLTCTNGQVPKMTNGVWACGSDLQGDASAAIAAAFASPPPIGSITPGSANFTAVTTTAINIPLSPGMVGTFEMPEDPANGDNRTGFKAPAVLAADVMYTMPAADGSANQCLKTNGSKVLFWAACQ